MMTKFLWVLTILGSLSGSVALTLTLFMTSAPQQAAGAAIAVAMGVLPYCLARAWSELRRPSSRPPAQ